jgi:hypothetical protein
LMLQPNKYPNGSSFTLDILKLNKNLLHIYISKMEMDNLHGKALIT